jgi:hypothetical protein
MPAADLRLKDEMQRQTNEQDKQQHNQEKKRNKSTDRVSNEAAVDYLPFLF